MLVSLAYPVLMPAQTPFSLVDFESLPEGQSAASQVSGLAFANATVLQSAASLNEVEFPPHSGAKVICDVGGPMSITFSQPITSITGYFTHQSVITIQALATNGGIIAQTSSNKDNRAGSGTSAPNEALTLAWVGPVNKIVIQGDPGGSSFTLDDLGFASFAAPPATFSVDYLHLGFEWVIGRAAPPPQALTVTADPDISFTATSSAAWLRVSPASGKTTANLAVFISPTNLVAGSYVGTLLFTGPKRDTVTVQVVLRVLDRPQVTATPQSFSFSWRAGDPLPASQKLFVGARNANVDYFTMTKDPWVKTDPTYATTGLAGFSLAVSVDPGKLAPGHYDSAVYVYATEATNSPLTIPISLDVLPRTAAGAQILRDAQGREVRREGDI